MNLLFELGVLFFLFLLNGLFAMAETAVVSSRRARLQSLADAGNPRAKAALALVTDPTRFLSTVQIGITLVGVFAGAFGGAALAGDFAAVLQRFSWLAPHAAWLSFVVVVGGITLLSLIIGELVPKRIALANPEGRAMLIAGPMTTLSRLAHPAVQLLTASTNALLRVCGIGQETAPPPSEEEISNLIEQGTSAGVFHHAERAMVEGVLQLDELPVTEIMTHRARIVWLNIADSDEVNWRKIVTSGHSHFPVYEGARDQVLGMVSVKSLWANVAIGLPNDLRHHLTQPLTVPHSLRTVQLLELFKKTGKHLALVTDEFGSIQGLVTLIDVMEAIVGDLPQPGLRNGPSAVRREDGSWLADGGLAVDELRQRVGLPPLPGEEDEDFETLGGFVLHHFGYVPQTGEHFTCAGWRFEVANMARHRVDKVLLQPIPANEQPS